MLRSGITMGGRRALMDIISRLMAIETGMNVVYVSLRSRKPASLTARRAGANSRGQ
jgi:hypothetical protein